MKLSTLSFKLLLIATSALILSDTVLAKDSNRIVLTAPGLSFIDGTSFGINEFVIANIRHIGCEIRKIQVGTKSKPADKPLGKYEYNGTKYCLSQLVELENTLSLPEQKALQSTLLEGAKNDICELTVPFMDHANDAKEYMIQLIEEFCTKSNRKDSMLLKWSQQKRGTELNYFRENLKTFKALDVFCKDLINFLTVLVDNCPKGFQRYQDFKRQFEQRKA